MCRPLDAASAYRTEHLAGHYANASPFRTGLDCSTAGDVQHRATGGGRLSGELYKVVELILDRGLVIDVFVRVSVIGLEVVTIDARVVVAGVDAYLRFAEVCGRLDLTGSSPRIGRC